MGSCGLGNNDKSTSLIFNDGEIQSKQTWILDYINCYDCSKKPKFEKNTSFLMITKDSSPTQLICFIFAISCNPSFVLLCDFSRIIFNNSNFLFSLFRSNSLDSINFSKYLLFSSFFGIIYFFLIFFSSIYKWPRLLFFF